jgi:asparagine synthase (glutamine-hydrolysing)
MCGIAGFLSSTLRDEDNLVYHLVREVAPRGPDFQAVSEVSRAAPQVVFGHARLSIIDLNPRSNQPFWDSEHTVCVTYNGEIFNYLELRAELVALGHEFRTGSDTEVLVEAYKEWGLGALGRFVGMFAFGLYDSRTRELVLARDRFGVKPLYMARTSDSVWFCSTPVPLARALGLRPDASYVSRGVRFLVYEDEHQASPFMGVEAVPPSHCMVFRLGEGGILARRRRYYDLRERVESLRPQVEAEPDSALVERVRATLDEAVRLRLRSDVPIGVSLSGGLDSSILAFLVQRHAGEVHGFTFGHPDSAESEAPSVVTLARRFAIRNVWIWPTAEEMREAFWETMRAQSAPFPDEVVVAQFLVYRAARRQGVKVVLGGQGGDEAFMGYRKYLLAGLDHAARHGHLLRGLREALAVARTALSEAPSASRYWRMRSRYLSRGGIRASSGLTTPAPIQLLAPGFPCSDGQQILDVTRSSLPTLLRYEDRNSMHNGVESRLPYMDHRVVELGLALPARVKVRDGYGKWILRKAFEGDLPRELCWARLKRGFDLSSLWVTSGLGDVVRGALTARAGDLKRAFGFDINPALGFPDESLTAHGNRMAEAVGLIWLADHSSSVLHQDDTAA